MLGSNRVYLKAKLPLGKLLRKNNESEAFVESNYETDNEKITNYPDNSATYYQFNGKVYNETLAATFGVLVGGNALKIYIGAGFAKRDLFWGADIVEYQTNRLQYQVRAKHVNQSIKGPMGEAGIFLRLGVINLMGGMSLIAGSGEVVHREANIGIGFNFKRNK